MYDISLAQRGQRGLRYTNVTLHATQQERVALSGHSLEQTAEHITAEAGEKRLINGLDSRQQGSNFGHGSAQAFRILRADQGRDFQDPRSPDEQL